METKAPSQLSDFDPVTLFELPERSPSGKILTLKIRALQFMEVVQQMKRLPGEIPGEDWREAQDYTLENLDALEHDMKLAEPVIAGLVGAAVLEPAITFTDPPEPGKLPWSWLSIRNRAAVFRFVLEWSGFAGGAAESSKSVDGDEAGGSAGGVGSGGGLPTP